MPSVLNIAAGFITWLGGNALAFALWNPAIDFIEYFPTELYILTGVAWLGMLFIACCVLPLIMFIADDKS